MKRLFAVLLCTLLLSSCASQTTSTERDGMMDVGITHGISSPDPEQAQLIFSGADVEITYTMKNREGRQRWGLQIFVNGMQQPFFVDDSNSATVQYNSVFETHEEKTYQIRFHPIAGMVGDVLTVQFVVMLNPEYVLPDPRNDPSYRAYHTITQIRPWCLYINQDIAPLPNIAEAQCRTNPLPNTTKKEKIDITANIYQEDTLPNILTAERGGHLNLQIGLSGGNQEDSSNIKYRVSLYINQHLIPCLDDGTTYVDMMLKKDNLVLFPIALNLSDIADVVELTDNNNIYVMAVPIIDGDLTSSVPQVLKSRSIPLLIN